MDKAKLMREINLLYRERDEKQAALDLILDECRKINEKPSRTAEELYRLSELYSEARKLRQQIREINQEISKRFAIKYKMEHRNLFPMVDNNEKGLFGGISSKAETYI